MLIREVMTETPACCKPTDTLEMVAKLMRDRDCGEIPVCDGTRLVGVVTDRDIILRGVASGKALRDVPVEYVMTTNVYSVRDTAKLETALDLMEKNLVRRLPVVDAAGKVIGIVSEADLIAKVPTPKVARLLKSVAERTRSHARMAL